MSDLPGPEFEALIHPHIGDLTTFERSPFGNSSDIAGTVESDQGAWFIKAMKNKAGGRLDSLVREAAINPFVAAVSPRLLWQAEDDDWLILGFELVAGRSAEFEPGSDDLGAVVRTLNQIAVLELPAIARSWRETRWDRFTVDDEADLFRGDDLLYTDIHHHNFLIGPERTWAVDWAWPTRGAGFIDPACLVHQLIAAGHTAEEAENWAAECKPWQPADPRAIDAFAAAKLRMYTAFADRRPEQTWLAAMAEAARAWATHRGINADAI